MNLMERLASPQLEPLLLVLLNFLWQGTLIAVLWKVGLLIIGQGRPHARYAWSLFAFAAIVVVPAITLVLEVSRPSWGVRPAIADLQNSPSESGRAFVKSDVPTAANDRSTALDREFVNHPFQTPSEGGDFSARPDMSASAERENRPWPHEDSAAIQQGPWIEFPVLTSPNSVDSLLLESDQGDDARRASDFVSFEQSSRWEITPEDGGASLRDDRFEESRQGSVLDLPVVLEQCRQFGHGLLASARQQQATLLLVWWLGLLAFSLKLMVGSISCVKLRREHGPLEQRNQSVVDLLAEQLGLRFRAPLVRVSHHVSEAIAVGLFRPMVLMPIAWIEQLPPETVQAILAHELAHLRRYDLAVNFLQRVVETCFFFHPAVWWISNHVRFERECCCDQMAVQATGDRVAYAKALAEVARIRLACQPHGLVASFLGGKRMNLLKRVHCLLGKAPRRRPLRLSSLTALFVLTSVASLSAMTVLRPQDEERQREERDRVQQRDREEERERLEQRDRQRAQEREQRDVERRRTREEREARKGRRQRARETREEPQSDVDARRRGRIDADRSDAIDPRERAPDNRDFNPRERQGRYPDVSDERARAPFDSHLWHPPVGRGDLPPEPHFGANVPHSTDLPPHVNDPYGRRFHGEEHAPFPRGVEPYGDGRHPPMGAPGYTGESRPEGPFESAPRPPRGTPDSRGEFFDAPAPSDPSGSNRFGPQGPPMSRQQPNVPRVQQGENVDEELLQMMREMRNEIRQLQREVETLRQQVEVAPRLRGQDLPQRGVDPLRAPRDVRSPDRLEDPRRRAPAVDEMRMREPRRSADEFFPQANTQPAPLSSPATPAPSTRPALPERLSQPREVAPQSGNPLPSSPIAPARAAEPQERALPTPAAQPLLDDALPPVTAEEATVDPVDAGEESAPVPSNPSQESAAKESRDEGDGR